MKKILSLGSALFFQLGFMQNIKNPVHIDGFALCQPERESCLVKVKNGEHKHLICQFRVGANGENAQKNPVYLFSEPIRDTALQADVSVTLRFVFSQSLREIRLTTEDPSYHLVSLDKESLVVDCQVAQEEPGSGDHRDFQKFCENPPTQDDQWTIQKLHGIIQTQTCPDLEKFLSTHRTHNLTSKKIVSVKAFSYFPNIETLLLDYNKIVDISPLKNMEKLTTLVLWENPIEGSRTVRNCPPDAKSPAVKEYCQERSRPSTCPSRRP
jgi:hypothetical protein